MPQWLGLLAALLLVTTPLHALARNLVTLAHEAGHALVVTFSSGELDGVTIDRDGGGLTTSYGTDAVTIPNSLAGYLAPSAVGLGALALLHAGAVIGALLAMFAAVVVMLMVIHNAFGAAVAVTVGGGLFLTLRYGSPALQAFVVAMVAWVLLLGAIRAAFILVGPRDGSDAAHLGRNTLTPSAFWAWLFVLGTSAVAMYAAWLAFVRW
jgi:hypothetical protein